MRMPRDDGVRFDFHFLVAHMVCPLGFKRFADGRRIMWKDNVLR